MPATTIDTITYHARPLAIVREWELCKQFFRSFSSMWFSKRYWSYKRYRRIRDLPIWKHTRKNSSLMNFLRPWRFLNYKKIGPSGRIFFPLLYLRDFFATIAARIPRQLGAKIKIQICWRGCTTNKRAGAKLRAGFNWKVRCSNQE